ncbi:outer membrane beta-barrel protein [Paraglaciecola sp.]|uniref:outer membrane beta-barrel protein n=1 Tax=Paraglaciecola sp. TaxID=1920173 RepID=UPI0030F37967
MNKFFSLFLLLITSFQCVADSTYIGLDYIFTDIELGNENVKPGATALRVGVSNNNMAFEAQYLISNSRESIYRIEFDLQQSIATYFVMQSDIIDGFGIDILLGYAMTEMAVSGPENTYNGEDNYNGFSWGVTIHQQIPNLEQVHVKLGYQSFYKDSDIEITGISLGLTYQF